MKRFQNMVSVSVITASRAEGTGNFTACQFFKRMTLQTILFSCVAALRALAGNLKPALSMVRGTSGKRDSHDNRFCFPSESDRHDAPCNYGVVTSLLRAQVTQFRWMLAMAGLFIFLTAAAVEAAEPAPGSACSIQYQIMVSGGPETTGVRNLMICNGSTWQ